MKRAPKQRLRRLPLLLLATGFALSIGCAAAPLNDSVTWVGNSFPGANNKWVQNFFIHTRVRPDGTVNYQAKSLIYRWKP